MGVLDQTANDIATHLEAKKVDHRVCFDPFLTLGIIGCICSVVATWLQCKMSSKQAVEHLRNPGVLERWHMRRIIRKTINDQEMESYVGPKLMDAFFEVGATITDDEMEKLFAEAEARQTHPTQL